MCCTAAGLPVLVCRASCCEVIIHDCGLSSLYESRPGLSPFAMITMLRRWIVVPIMIVWSSWASIPFIGGAVPANRRALAVFPLVLLYTAVGWLALIT